MTKMHHVWGTAAIATIAGAPVSCIIPSMFGALVPDMDIALGIRHRTWTHWFPFYLTAIALTYIFVPPYSLDIPGTHLHFYIREMCLWFFYGCLLHLVEDVITTMGIPFMQPTGYGWGNNGEKFFKAVATGRRWTLGWTTTGGRLEGFIISLLVVAAIFIFCYRLYLGNDIPI